MAFNVLNVGFPGTVATPYSNRQNWQSNGDTNDIFYHIGTNFGTAAWVNPLTTPFVSFVGTEGSINIVSNGEFLVDHSTAKGSPGANFSSNTQAQTIARFNFTDLVVRLTGIQISTYSSTTTTATSVSLQGSVDGTNWITLDNIPNISMFSSQSWDAFELIPASGAQQRYYQAVRLRWTALNQQSWGSVNEIKLYGDIKRTDGGIADRTPIPTTFASLGNVDVEDAVVGDSLRWFEGGVQPLQKTIYRVSRQTMTGDIALGDEQMTDNFFVLDPNGAARNFDLPVTPTKNQYFRVRSLDNSFEIRIREAAVTQATIGGAGGPGLTQADMWYDGTQWSIITY